MTVSFSFALAAGVLEVINHDNITAAKIVMRFIHSTLWTFASSTVKGTRDSELKFLLPRVPRSASGLLLEPKG
jgi:hypothetical protein